MSRRLRVGFERTALELDAGGVARAVRGLRAALRARGDVELVDLAHPRRSEAPHPLARGLERELAWFPLGLPRRARALALDVLHCPAALAPPRSGVPLVVTVHDAIARRHPRWFERANAVQQRLVAPALRRADLVLCPSGYAAGEVAELFGVDPGRIEVVPLGIDARFAPGPADRAVLGRLGVVEPYLLAVGTLQPRKNLGAALHAFELLAPAAPEHQLVVVGASGWHDSELTGRVNGSPAAARIVLAGRVDDDALVSLYRGASCLVFPSLDEGFGFPPLEAMACGTPVVCSDAASLPEAVGDAALTASPDDPAALAAAICRALEPGTAERLARAGRERAGTFTWERCASRTVAAYARVAR